MRSIYLIAAVVGFVAFGVVAKAEGAEKARKPSLCVNYQVLQADLAVCRDGKKPTIFTRFAEVSAPGAESGTVKVLVGYR